MFKWKKSKLVSRESDWNHCTCNSFCDTEILSLLIEHNELGMIEQGLKVLASIYGCIAK